MPVAWKDRKVFVADLKTIYKTATLEQATANLYRLAEKWTGKYAIAVKSWEKNWEDLTTYFNFPVEIRRIIYTTNTVEAYLLPLSSRSRARLPRRRRARRQPQRPHRRFLASVTKRLRTPTTTVSKTEHMCYNCPSMNIFIVSFILHPSAFTGELSFPCRLSKDSSNSKKCVYSSSPTIGCEKWPPPIRIINRIPNDWYQTNTGTLHSLAPSSLVNTRPCMYQSP